MSGGVGAIFKSKRNMAVAACALIGLYFVFSGGDESKSNQESSSSSNSVAKSEDTASSQSTTSHHVKGVDYSELTSSIVGTYCYYEDAYISMDGNGNFTANILHGYESSGKYKLRSNESYSFHDKENDNLLPCGLMKKAKQVSLSCFNRASSDTHVYVKSSNTPLDLESCKNKIPSKPTCVRYEDKCEYYTETEPTSEILKTSRELNIITYSIDEGIGVEFYDEYVKTDSMKERIRILRKINDMKDKSRTYSFYKTLAFGRENSAGAISNAEKRRIDAKETNEMRREQANKVKKNREKTKNWPANKCFEAISRMGSGRTILCKNGETALIVLKHGLYSEVSFVSDTIKSQDFNLVSRNACGC